MIELTDFVKHADVPQETIDRYRGRVPDELIELWQHYGYGSFGQGFFRLVDPDLYDRHLGDTLGRVEGEGIAIPIMVTGLADLICWEPGHGVIAIVHRDADTRGLGQRLSTMLKLVALEGLDQYATRVLDWEMYPKAVEAHGPLGYDESFTYVPLLSLGGKKDVEHMRKRETIPAIKVYVEFQGPIEH